MKIQFSIDGFVLTNELEKYASQKMSRLNRRVPRRLRSTVGCRVAFTQTVKKGIKLNTCDIALTFEGGELTARETTQHMYAALDIAAVQVEQQLKNLLRRERHGIIRRRFRAS